MMCKKDGSSLHVSLIRLGKVVFQSMIDNTNQEWQRNYSNVYYEIDGLPSIEDITTSLNFMLQASCKAEKQMQEYLRKNALFIDKYII